MNNLVKVSDLFDVIYGVNLELVNLIQCKSTNKNSVPFVSRTEKNNGVSAYVEMELDVEPNPAHTLSVAGGGSVLSTFYQPLPYYSGRDLYILVPKRKMSVMEMLFYAKCISANKYKYNYGRQANKTLKNILLPFQISEELKTRLNIYHKELEKSISRKPLIDKKIKLETEKWEDFIVGKLFKVTLGSPIHGLEIEEIVADKSNKNIPYVTRTATNNGVELFVENNIFIEEKINSKNCITIGAEGFKAFFQPLNFINGNKINIIRHGKLNKYIALFINTLLNLEIEKKFNYGRGATKERISQLKLKLPVNNGNPDFEYMENYIKSLPYSSNLA
ncbi:restriction endonuclease subunit S [Patescibacteria group bacterium]|nr:restriction endonuclease subunit S [Patescibacteria group bacterium]